jgi:DNA-binding CsgD family transcriptional regulator
MLGAAEAQRECAGAPRVPFLQPGYDRMLAELRTLLPATEFDRAWAFGRGLSIDDAVQLALGPLPTRPPAPVAAFPNGLTAREVDVLRLVAEGLPDAEVAERLFLARRTVNTHLTSIYTKLGVNSRSAATRFAVEHGLT